MPVESIQDLPVAACRACGGALRFCFEVEVLGDTTAKYHNCSVCDSLMVLEPHWLERSYQTTLFPDPDTGALYRTLYVNRYIRRMRAVGLLPKRYRSLDYGSGLGMLVSLELDRGADAHGFDRYSEPRFAQLVCKKQLPDGPFDLISSVEVLEHLLDPIAVLRTFQSRLAPSGIVLLSTELFQRERWPDPSSWHYVDRQHGQHITLFTRAGLKAAAKSAGLRHVYTVNKGKTPFLHVFVHEHRSSPVVRLGFLVWQHLWGELRESIDLGI
jgi:SAM-dependent methyltransferase